MFYTTRWKADKRECSPHSKLCLARLLGEWASSLVVQRSGVKVIPVDRERSIYRLFGRFEIKVGRRAESSLFQIQGGFGKGRGAIHVRILASCCRCKIGGCVDSESENLLRNLESRIDDFGTSFSHTNGDQGFDMGS